MQKESDGTERSEELKELKELTYLKSSELKSLRESLLKDQNGICPILGIEIDPKDAVVDHHHPNKALPLGESVPCGTNGNGCVRGVLHKFANAIEGKVYNSFKRTGLHKKDVDLPTILRNMADYIENPPAPENIVHPREVPKEPKLGKRVFNKIKKAHAEEYPNRKPLEYPKSGKWTKQLKELSERYDIRP